MGYTWEDAITFIGSVDGKTPTTATDVHKDDKLWLKSDGRMAGGMYEFQSKDYNPKGLDVWVAWYFRFQTANGHVTNNGSYVVGAHIDYPNIDGAGGKLGGFTGSVGPLKVLVGATPKKYGRIDATQFADVATLLGDIVTKLDGWLKEVEGWASTVAGKDSDWQGSAAGAFRAVLMALRNELDGGKRNIAQGDLGSYLTTCKTQLEGAITTLNTGWEEWYNSYRAWPTNCVNDALLEGLKGATLEVNPTAVGDVSFSRAVDESKIGGISKDVGGLDSLKFTLKGAAFGDPAADPDGFWKAVEKRGRDIWLQHVVDVLDKAADTALGSIATAYGSAAGVIKPDPFPLIMPTPKDPKTGDPGAKDDPNKKDEKTPDPKLDNLGMGGGGGGGGPQTKNLGGGPDLKNLGLGSGGGGTGGKGKLDLTGAGGGSGGNHGGTGGNTGLDLINPNLGSGGLSDLFPGGSGSSRPVTVPPGSVISKDGRIVDENGKPVLDANGNPMVAGPNYTIGPDGTLRDEKGNTVSPVSYTRCV